MAITLRDARDVWKMSKNVKILKKSPFSPDEFLMKLSLRPNPVTFLDCSGPDLRAWPLNGYLSSHKWSKMTISASLAHLRWLKVVPMNLLCPNPWDRLKHSTISAIVSMSFHQKAIKFTL